MGLLWRLLFCLGTVFALTYVVNRRLVDSVTSTSVTQGGVRHSRTEKGSIADKRRNGCTWMPPLPMSSRRTQGVNLTTARRNVVYFTDGTNFDDVVTLMYLVKQANLRLVAIYVAGNGWANVGPSIENIHNILHMVRDELSDTLIVGGSYFSLVDEMRAAARADEENPRYSYRWAALPGPSGIIDADTMLGLARDLPTSPVGYDPYSTYAADRQSLAALLRAIDAMLGDDERVTMLSTGTLTPVAKLFSETYYGDVAAAARKNLLPRVDGLYVMGGAVFSKGNVYTAPWNDRGEFNIFLDPDAAGWAFRNLSQSGIPVFLVPLDATNNVPITTALLNELLHEPRTPEAQLIGRLMNRLRTTWFDVDAFFHTAFLWDVSAAIVMMHPSVVINTREMMLRVVTEEGPFGPNQGWTKPCSHEEVASNRCSPVIVVENLYPQRVSNALLTALQTTVNSAQRSPVCHF